MSNPNSAPPPPPATPEDPAEVADREKRRLGGAWLLSVLLVLLLGGTGLGTILLLNQNRPAEPTNPSAPPSTETPSAPETITPPEPEPEPAAPISIPSCAELNPIAQEASDEALEAYGQDAFTPPPGEVGRAAFDLQFGQAAQISMDGAAQVRGCLYVFSYHDALYQYVAEIDEASREPLLQALRDEPAYEEQTIDGAQAHVWAEETEGFGTFYTVHAFTGEVWVALSTTATPSVILPPVLEAMRTANPGLGEPGTIA